MPPASTAPIDHVYWKTGGHCAYCGAGLSRGSFTSYAAGPAEPGAWVVDCWVPASTMGPVAYTPTNLWPACCACHAEKGELNGSAYVVQRRTAGLPTHPLAEAYIDEMGDWFTRKLMGLDAGGSSR